MLIASHAAITPEHKQKSLTITDNIKFRDPYLEKKEEENY